MPRPRYERLAPEKRDAILDAAAAEFGEKGYELASYNRIIERAGLSKGAMYYYFDDKEDLFRTVVEDAVEQMFAIMGPLGEADTPERFWADFVVWYGEMMAFVGRTPRVAAMIPVFLKLWKSPGAPASLRTLDDRMRGWVVEMLAVGRRAGAIRDDVPDDLLVAVTMGLGEALDVWMMGKLAESGEAEGEGLDSLFAVVVDMLRRVLGP